MNLLEGLYSVGRLLPEVRRPERTLSTKERIMWTAAVLGIYYVLSLIPMYGLEAVRGHLPQDIQIILAMNLGTIFTLSIGPIVIASIILQLLVGAELIKVDLRSPEGRAKFMTAQKSLAVFFSLFEAWMLTSSGYLLAKPGMELLVFLQAALGPIILLYLDEVVLKWGIGSGISLFIAANVTRATLWMLFGPHPTSTVVSMLNAISTGSAAWLTHLLVLLLTALVFIIVVYAEDIRVNIPIALSLGRGAGGYYPVKLLYLNVIPVIFATALFANIQLWAFLLKDTPLSPLLGVYNEVSTPQGTRYELVGGLAYFLSPPLLLKDISLILSGNVPSTFLPDLLRALIYIILLSITSVFFGLLWVEVAGFGPREIARQLALSGFGIPGFRRDPRVIERVLEKYIPPTAFLGSLFVGLLAGFTGVFLSARNISGTGILLAVQIINRYHELLSREKFFDAHPLLKKVFG